MMRGPSCWAVAVRTPDGHIAEVVAARPLADAAPPLWRLPVIRGRRRARRVARHRLPRARHLGELRDAQERGDEGEVKTEISPRADHLLVRARDRLRADAVQGRPGAADELAADRRHGLVRGRRGLIRVAVFIAYIVLIWLLPDLKRVFQYHGAEHKAINALEAGAELSPDQRAEVQFDPSTLRNSFFALGHGDRHLRLRASSAGPSGTG